MKPSNRATRGQRLSINRALVRPAAIGLVAMALSAAVFGAPSIFDDDWKPPPESSKPAPAAPAKPPPDEPVQAAPRLPPRARPTPEPVKPAPEPVKPGPGPVKPVPPVVPAAPARAPVPGPAAVAAAEKTIKEVFKTEYAHTTAADQISFSRTLLSEAEQTRNDPATLYVLLRDARDLASGAGEPEVALEAARGIRDNFLLDARAGKEMEESTLSTAIRVLCNSPVPIASYDVTHRASDLATEMAELDLAEGDYPGAAQIGAIAEMAARKTRDWEYPTRIHSRVSWIQVADSEFELARGAIASLKTSPADPAANLAAGKFDFVYLDRPDLGLPLLAKGSDPALKALATKDRAADGPGSTPAQLTTAAEAWDDAAKNELAAIKDAMQRRALFLYDKAIPDEQGLDQAAAQKREEALRVSRVLHGLTVEFFRGENLGARAFARDDKTILYRWDNITPEISIPRNHFSARWTGFIKAAPGHYKIMAVHDDGARVWIDGQLVIDHWGSGANKDSVPVQFTGRLASLKVEYHQITGPATMGLGWIVPGSTKAVGIPIGAFFHEPIPPGPVIQPYVQAGADGIIHLPAGAATLHGAAMSYVDGEDRPSHIGGWEQLTDWMNWDFEAREGDYFVDLDHACDGGNAGSDYTVSIGTNRLNSTVADTGGWNNYDTTRLGRVHLGPGLQSVRIKAARKPHQIVMDLHEVVLTPVKAGE